jgi:plastocyanin
VQESFAGRRTYRSMTTGTHTVSPRGRRRTGVLVVASLLLVVSMFAPGSGAMAAPGAVPIVALPNGATVGFAPRTAVMPRGGSIDLVGADTTAHNIACAKKKRRRPLCQSGFVTAGQTVPLKGAHKLKPGTYLLICQLHPQMTVNLTVAAAR